MKVSMILEAIDRASAPLKKVTGAVEGLSKKGFGPVGHAADRARAATARFTMDAHRAEAIGRRMGISMRSYAARGLDAVRRSAIAAGNATKSLLGHMGRIAAKAAIVGAGGLVAGGIAGAFALARGAITTGSEFEQLDARLKTALGSAEKAKAGMAFITKFAADTPYAMQQVVEAFIVAKNQGIDPFSGSMTVMGDAASAMGKTMEEAALAVGDAGRNSFERLLDFGISASQKGGEVALSYVDKNGKQMTKTVKKGALSMQKALFEIWGGQFGGGMALQSKTLAGIWGNLGDKWTMFQLKIAKAGIFDRVKNDLQGVLDWAERLEKDGTLDQWAQEASRWLTVLWEKADKFIHDTDWRSVALGVASITTSFIALIIKIGEAAGALQQFQMNQERARLNKIVRDPSVWQLLFTDRPKAIGDANKGLDNLDRLEYGRPQARRGPGGVLTWPQGSFRAPTARPPVAPNGAVKIKISLDNGLQSRTTGITGSGISVETGRAMSGVA